MLICHVLFLLFEELPRIPLLLGVASHMSYLVLLRGFPFLKLFSLSFVVSTAMLIASNYMWISHFTSHYHHMMHVFCFLMFNVWLVPFGFFVSLSINEAVLPDRLASSARETYSEGVKHVLLRLLFLLLIQLAHGSSAASKSTRPRDGASSLLRCDRAPSAPLPPPVLLCL